MNKRILVTGGAGFIGSHLCERLLNEGNEVICVDNFFTGRKGNISHLLNNPRFEVITHDIINPLSLAVDEIYNFASPASPPHYQYDPIFTLKTNVIGTLNMVELARMYNAKIMQASTSEVYGDPLEHPQREEYRGNVNPIGPRACYDEGKRASETICFDYWRKYGISIKVIRIFNTYGPRMREDDGRVVSNFVVQALKGEDITVYGDGSQTRSFCYVSDLIDGIILMMNSEEGFRGPVNLGNPGEFRIIELAEMVLKMTGSKSKIVYKPLPEDDPKMRRPDITLAKNKLGWEPKVPLVEGLKETIAYFKKFLNI
ncbi:MAG: SDR family oxidoreductase [Spirochaetia bacterium]|nr:SDR family oxidoreductase [Spirochaetota bacterium]MCX8097059.1 SDR family oxidoreductase [Spirochaetota bacterium]MDW8111746.1 SDR family oxidoreductase [Spirochaetia bacterium]